jgi:threonine-phosphate decarboxylase
MVDISRLVKDRLKLIEPYFHGGNVWDLSNKFNIPIDQIVDFSISTNPLGAPETAKKVILEKIKLIKHYPDPDHQWLLQALAKPIDVKPNNTIIGNGSTELIYLFTEVFLDNEHEAIIPVPSFSEYKAAIERFGGTIKFLHLESSNNFKLNIENIKKVISEKTRIIFLCNPNSPTGVLYEKKELINLVSLAEKQNILIFIDEDYIDFVEDSKRYSMAKCVNQYNNLFVLRSLTKFYGLAGLRIGFGIGSPEIINILNKVKMPWSVNSLAMFATEAAIKDTKFVRKSRSLISKNRQEMIKLFKKINWLKVFPSETNFLLIKIISGELTSTKIKEQLEKKGLMIRDCKDFDGLNDKYFRVTIRKTKENKKLIENIKSLQTQK